MTFSGHPARDFDVALLDLDGVVYVGEYAVPQAVESIEAARGEGMRPAYVTNNASRTPSEVADHLHRIGLSVTASDVVTSAQAGAHALRDLLADTATVGELSNPAGPVLAIGGPGVAVALTERGLTVTRTADDDPIAVLQGFGRDIAWADLVEASIAVSRGVPWVATNPDTSIPTPRGRAPGNGAFIQAVSLATGRRPDLVAGKPFRPLIMESLERTGAQRALMIGDRLDTDIEAGTNSGLATMLVMTGVTDVIDVVTARRAQRADLVCLDLTGLLDSHPPVERIDPTNWRCADVHVTLSESGLCTDADPVDVENPLKWALLMRCAAAAAWDTVDAGGTVDLTAPGTADIVRVLQARVDDLRRAIGR